MKSKTIKLLSLLTVILLQGGLSQTHAGVFEAAYFQEILENYYAVQNSLSEGNLEKSQTHADSLLKTLSKGPSPQEVMTMKELNTVALLLKESEDMAAARKHFERLSSDIFHIIGYVDNLDVSSIYAFKCSMAFDGKGANWIQKTEEIRNPYFGEKMLKCGTLLNGKKESTEGSQCSMGSNHNESCGKETKSSCCSQSF